MSDGKIEKECSVITIPINGICCFLQFNKEGVLLLRRFDSRLSKDLPSDLQKLRCKVCLEAKSVCFFVAVLI